MSTLSTVRQLGVVLPQAGQQHVEVAAGRRRGDVGDPVDELRDRRALPDHLHLGVVGRPAVVAEQPGVLAAQLEQLVEQGVVLRPGPVEVLLHQRRPGVPVAAEGRERQVVGVVGGDHDLAVVARRVARDEVGRQPLERRRVDADRADTVADVLGELLGDRGLPLGELAQPAADVLVLVHAGPAEVPQRQAVHPAAALVELLRVDAGQHVVELAVEPDLGQQPLRVLLGLLGAGPDALVGVHVREQPGRREGVVQGEVEVVPERQHVGGVVAALPEGLDVGPGLVELAVAALGEPGLPVSGGQGQRRGSGGVGGHPPSLARRPSRSEPHFVSRG